MKKKAPAGRDIGWHGPEGSHLRAIRIDARNLAKRVIAIGGTVENDSCGRWNVLQLIAPSGMLWPEGLRLIKVEWPKGESPQPACRDAWSRISGDLKPINPNNADLYAED